MPTLFSWYLRDHGPAILAHGVVSGHHKLAEGTDIHTSQIVSAVEAVDGAILLKTWSGSLYELRPEELLPPTGPDAPTLPRPELLGLEPDLWDRCAQAREQALQAELQAARSLLPGTLRLRTVGPQILSALWTGPEELVQRLDTGFLVGMFEDSVFARGAGPDGPVDFRCFLGRGRFVPYVVSPSIRRVLIVNDGMLPLCFESSGQETLCPAGQTTEIPLHPDQPKSGAEECVSES